MKYTHLDMRLSADDETTSTPTIESDVQVAPAKPKLKKPPMYKVVFLNDDYTTKEFVVEVLQLFFGLEFGVAYWIMETVHTTGSGVAGIFPQDIAETKSEQVNTYAQLHQFPLKSITEMAD